MNTKIYSHLEQLKLKHVLASLNGIDNELVENDYIIDLVKDPYLLERCEEQRYQADDSPSTFSPMWEELCNEFVRHIDKSFFGQLEEIPNDISPFIDAIITHPEYFKDGLTTEDLASLVLLSHNRKYITKWLNEVPMPDVLKDRLAEQIGPGYDEKTEAMYNFLTFTTSNDYIDALNMQILDEEIKAVGQKGNNEELAYTDYNSLTYNGRERRALQVYGGVADGKDPISQSETGYDTLNMLLFPGTGNEKQRISEEHRPVVIAALRNPDDILDYYLDIYSAMYKYGKKTIRDYETKRVDRSYSLDAMEESGHKTLSYYSTSQVQAFLDSFASKRGIDLINVTITQGTPCIEFADILGDTYMHAHEHEILLPPGIEYTMEEEELTPTDLTIKDKDGNPPRKKVHLTTVPRKEKAKPLSAEEERDFEEQERILYNKDNINFAIRYLKILRSKSIDDSLDYSSVEDALENEYIRWKTALQRIYRYSIREIEIEIDKDFEREQKLRQDDEVEYTQNGHEHDDFCIGEDEFDDLARQEDIKSLKKALGGLASLFKGLITDEKDEKGDRN